MAGVLTALHELRAESFADDDPADLSMYGLEGPRFTVTLRFESRAPEVLRIGGDGEHGMVYVASGRCPSVFMVTSEVMELVDRLIRGEENEI